MTGLFLIATQQRRAKMNFDKVLSLFPSSSTEEPKTKIIHIKDSRKEPDREVYIGRPGRFGNPIKKEQTCLVCKKKHDTAGSTLPCYRRWAAKKIAEDEAFREEVKALHLKTLVCYCAPGPCHGDCLAVFASDLNSKDAILFCTMQGTYGAFGNFYYSPFVLKGKEWKTNEHYYQAQKFAGLPDEEEIRLMPTAWAAASEGRKPSRPLDPKWDDNKEQAMYDGLVAKFTQHPGLKEFLISTEKRYIAEHSNKELYWADGLDGSGKNRLGVLLMKLREQLSE